MGVTQACGSGRTGGREEAQTGRMGEGEAMRKGSREGEAVGQGGCDAGMQRPEGGRKGGWEAKGGR